MQINRLTLTLKDKNYESLFWNYYYSDYLKGIKFFIVFAIVLYAFFGILDKIIAPEMKSVFWIIRYLIVIPLGLLTIFIVELSREKKLVQHILTFDILLASYSILAMMYFGGESIFNAYYPGLILVILYGFIFLRLRFIYALLSSILIILGYYILNVFFIALPLPLAINNSIMLLAANLVGLMICYVSEFSSKNSFYQIHEVRREKDLIMKEKEILKNHNASISLEVRERRELYRKLFDGISSIIIISDESGNILDCNKAAYDILGDNIKDWSFSLKDLHQKTHSNSLFKQEILNKKNKKIPVETVFSSTYYKENKHFMTIIKTSEILYDNDFTEVLLAALNKSNDSIIITDPVGNIEYVNSAFMESTGYNKEDLLCKNARILKATQNNLLNKNLWDTIILGQVWTGEFCTKTKYGSCLWEKVKIFPFSNSKKEIAHFVALKKDISEFELFKKEKENSEKRFARIFNNIQDVYFESKFDGEILEISPSVEKLLGIPRQEIIGRSVLDFYVSPDDREKLISYALKNKIIKDYQLYMKSLTGDIKIISLDATLLWDENDNKTTFKIVGTLRDITERFESEKKLKEAYEKVVEYSLNLKSLKSQMIEQEKLASIGQLAAGVAHEINNSAGYIMSNLRSIKEYFDDLLIYVKKSQEIKSGHSIEIIQKVLHELKNIEKEIDLKFVLDDLHLAIDESLDGIHKIKEIVLNLKNFARGNRIEEMIYLEINEVIENSIKLTWNEIKYTLDIEKNLQSIPQIYGNQNQLIQVITNIFINAAQAIFPLKRKGILKIDTFSQGNYVVIRIEDNGPGIPQNIISKIFDPFFTTKEPGVGTGLGLNISYDIIVNKHKGKIEVDSKENTFTKFTIYLPINID